MKNFDDRRQSGRREFGGRDSGRPIKHKTTCSNCGRSCEVPFKPTPGKSVYCNDCFKKGENAGTGRSGGRDSGKFGRKDFGASNFRDKQMHQATCAKCGERCEVPFKPTGDKPVLCSNCFGASKGSPYVPAKEDHSKEQFEQLNRKLDKILKILEIMRPPKTVHIIGKPEREPKIMESKKKVKALKKAKPKKKASAKKTVKTAKSKKASA